MREDEVMKAILIIGCLFLIGCTDVNGAKEAIENTGLEPVNVGGYGILSCSEKLKI